MDNLSRELLLADLNVVKYKTIRSVRKQEQESFSLFRFGRIKAIIAVAMYTWLHAMFLTFEMLIIHVVLTV